MVQNICQKKAGGMGKMQQSELHKIWNVS